MSRPIYFVSLGPGDAELITLKSLHALQQADIIYCPSTVREPDKILSRAATLLHKLGIKGDIHLFSLPMSKDRTKAIKVFRRKEGGQCGITFDHHCLLHLSHGGGRLHFRHFQFSIHLLRFIHRFLKSGNAVHDAEWCQVMSTYDVGRLG